MKMFHLKRNSVIDRFGFLKFYLISLELVIDRGADKNFLRDFESRPCFYSVSKYDAFTVSSMIFYSV